MNILIFAVFAGTQSTEMLGPAPVQSGGGYFGGSAPAAGLALQSSSNTQKG